MATFNFKRAAQSLFPFFSPQLLKIFTDKWTETGDSQIALTETRQSTAYKQFFPGNLRDDGTVRMSEAQYFSGQEAFSLELQSYGIPDQDLMHLYPQFVEQGVTPDQFRRRMATLYTEVASNHTAVQQFYAANFGTGDLSIQALMSSALDPSTNPLVFEERIRKAQVGGEAALAGFNLDLSEVKRLAGFGLTQEASRNFFSQAATLLPNLNTLMARHNDPNDEFTLDELADALIIGDPQQRQNMQRLFSQEQSQFSPFNLFQVGQGGVVSGIRQS